MPVRTVELVPWLTGYAGKNLYLDLVSMSETRRGIRYMLTEEDSFSQYCRPYPIPNKEAHTVAKVLMDQPFNVYGLPDLLHSDNGKEFVNNLWRESFSEFKIQHCGGPECCLSYQLFCLQTDLFKPYCLLRLQYLLSFKFTICIIINKYIFGSRL